MDWFLAVFAFICLWVIAPILVGSRITDNKGRGTGLGGFLGFCLGWFGVIIAASLKDLRPEQAAAVQALMHRECPHCKESMRRDATVCPHCRGTSPAEGPAGVRSIFRAEDRPLESVERLAKATDLIKVGTCENALSLLWDELFAASKRGDAEYLQKVRVLALEIAGMPGARRTVVRDSLRLGDNAEVASALLESKSAQPQLEVIDVPADRGIAEEDPVKAQALLPVLESDQAPPQGRAIEIAKERYARGEVSRDEYQQLMADLAT